MRTGIGEQVVFVCLDRGAIDCGCGLTVPAGATCPTMRADCGAGLSPVPPSTLTAWLNANSTTVAIGAAAFFGLLMMRGGR